MKPFLLSTLLLVGLLCFAPAALAQFSRTPYEQVDILRVAPDDSAAFVPIRLPLGEIGHKPKVEVLSRQGDWEEVRLSYRFKYNGSADPNVCAMSLFEETFTGFQRTNQTR